MCPKALLLFACLSLIIVKVYLYEMQLVSLPLGAPGWMLILVPLLASGVSLMK